MKHNIAVVMGGFSSEYDVSVASGNVVFENLSKIRFNAYRVLIRRDKWVVLHNEQEFPVDKNDFSALIDGQKLTFDAVFNAIHGAPGEDGPLAGYFDLIGMPQTASGQFESALTFNKAECSMLLKGLGVNIAEAYYLARHEEYDSDEILAQVGLPCFVKPNRSGSSIGVSKVKSVTDLEEAIEHAFEVDSQIIIEAMVKGIEVACGVSNHSGFIKALAVTDIVPKNEFFDYESKYSGLSEEITPARIAEGTYAQILEESEFIYESLNLNGIARVDYIVTENGVPFLIEVNTIPGLSKESILPRQAVYAGITLGELFDQSVENALKSKS
ncbi:MAG TPA: D-alanine--D-alanine ligase [Cryomorphaceae bacterium]|nr:D-alanine--D-alanine ligase [Owenweeksia sp.]MBG00237.1 D-alanine--D-alanine ligase [Owenweeksia sp.]HAD96847.1 D-alanine--D-alanine ligase [Cryomorphaceae bacterium]HBF19689.1 D-alanine--D-alanine ligase [Cryomorphaceae bacterium]HCQ14971.1 D-alanine--D-alanine ligase [Cryomorphaceae bacterium]|tara:strand:+ start:1781 stop:2764 length:984 start_codon:yes stop_codon:yes gene_type:complete